MTRHALLWRLIYLQQMLKRSSALIQISTPTILEARYTTTIFLLSPCCGSKYYIWSSVCCFTLVLTDLLARQLATKKHKDRAHWEDQGCLNIVLFTKWMRPRSPSNIAALTLGICVPHPCYGSTHGPRINRSGNEVWSACNKTHKK